MVKAFVTGANGFIGSHLIGYLLARGDEVTGLVRPTSDLRPLLPLFDHYPQAFKLVVGDLHQPQTLGAGLDDVEYVYHLGAALMVTSENAFRETNVDGTRHLLEAVKQHNQGTLQRVLFTSSLAAAGPAPTPKPLDETATRQPVSWYGKSKRDAEDIAHLYSKQGLPLTIVRPVAVYGEREDLLARSAFPFVQMGLIPRLGFEKKLASFVYIADLVEGIVGAAESPNTLGKTYFLANPQPYDADEIPLAVADAMNTTVRIPVVTPLPLIRIGAWFMELGYSFTGAKPMATSDKARETRHRYWIATPAAAKQDFGWVAETTLTDGMKKTVDYWRNEQKQLRQQVLAEPRSQRVLKTFTLTTLIGLFESVLDLLVGGITFTGLANLLGLAQAPWWLTVGAITLTFAVLMGLMSLWTARRSALWQFLGGAAIGFTLEILNQLVLHWWEWNPATFGALPGPWWPALVLGGAAGLYPLIVNAVVQAFYRQRLRLGAGS